MVKNTLKINGIPAILWGRPSDKLFIAVHGHMSHKEDEIITIFVDEAIKKGYQVLSFDLPEHGEHYFHTDEQLCYFSKWLNENISF
jgi:hypothetical protein